MRGWEGVMVVRGEHNLVLGVGGKELSYFLNTSLYLYFFLAGSFLQSHFLSVLFFELWGSAFSNFTFFYEFFFQIYLQKILSFIQIHSKSIFINFLKFNLATLLEFLMSRIELFIVCNFLLILNFTFSHH